MARVSFLKRKAETLRYRPLVVGTLTSTKSTSEFSNTLREARSSHADIIEVRLDTFPEIHQSLPLAVRSAQFILTKIKRETRKPLLLTIRSHTEIGKPVRTDVRLDDSTRLGLFKSLLALTDLVDVEIRHLHLGSQVTRWAKRQGISVIHSTHDFRGPGQFRVLNQLLQQSRRLSGDLFKVAITPKNEYQLMEFLHWGSGIKNPSPVLIGMGQVGIASRYVGYSFGSLLTYGFLGKRAAPGQLPIRKLFDAVKTIYPAVKHAKTQADIRNRFLCD